MQNLIIAGKLSQTLQKAHRLTRFIAPGDITGFPKSFLPSGSEWSGLAQGMLINGGSQNVIIIIQFLRKKKMHLPQSFNSSNLDNIFLNSPSPGLSLGGQAATWEFKSFLECDDSIKYVQQFLDFQEQAPPPAQPRQEESPLEEQAATSTRQLRNKGRSLKMEKKKIEKVTNSPFHNYQKHLNNALKKLIIVPEFDASNESYKRAACEIWQQYLTLDIKTKRILHYIFNQNNEHIINDSELRAYGLWEILQTYGAYTFNKAKAFLSKLAIDQIDEQNIEGYLKTRKLKRHEGFNEYILQFRQELAKGYLKRRANLEAQH